MGDDSDLTDLSNEADEILDELDSLKELLDHELDESTESELEAILSGKPRPPSPPIESAPPPTPASPQPADQIAASSADNSSAPYPEPDMEMAIEEPVPILDEVVIPVLDEVVFSADEISSEADAMLAAMHPPPSPSAPSAEEIELLLEALLDREIPRLREELKQRISTELARLLPDNG